MNDAAVMAEDRADRVRMIRDSVPAVAPRGALGRVRALRFKPPGFDPGTWAQMGELGWIGLRAAEADGGAGLGMAELCALAEELGASLAPEPLIPSLVATALLAGDPALDAILAGRSLVLAAWQETAGVLDAPGTPGAPRRFLLGAAGADGFLVPVQENGLLALYLQPADGADLTTEPTQDGGAFGTLRPTGGRLVTPDCRSTLAAALEDAALATAAMLLGIMDQAFAMTLDYLRTRQQFGRAIGSFQVLQHRMADLRIQVALTRASVDAAAAVLDAPGSPQQARRAAVSRAKARASDAAMLVTRQAIQLHGGIGYTDEADIGLYLRRAMTVANQYGGAAFHRRRFAAESPDEDA